MLGSIRKFSSSIYAKIFLVIVAIPFIFWGMGPVFQSGKKNTIVEIGKEKISTQEFIDFIRLRLRGNENLNEDLIKKMLSSFIGDKLISFETDDIIDFSSFNKTVQAKEGRLIIFPPYWTHRHKGVVSKTQTKYIATGWYNYEKT